MRGVGRGWGMWEKETEGCGKKLEGVDQKYRQSYDQNYGRENIINHFSL